MSVGTTIRVFVYGTLKRGEPNHQWFNKDKEGYYKFLYSGKTKEKFPLIIGTRYNIPFLLCSPGNGTYVQGEVYEVDEKVLKDLDVLEDHPNYYVRELYNVTNIDANNSDCEKVWIYMIKNFKPELLKQTFYESYSNSGSHGLKYVERYLRDNTVKHKTDLFANYEDHDATKTK